MWLIFPLFQKLISITDTIAIDVIPSPSPDHLDKLFPVDTFPSLINELLNLDQLSLKSIVQSFAGGVGFANSLLIRVPVLFLNADTGREEGVSSVLGDPDIDGNFTVSLLSPL